MYSYLSGGDREGQLIKFMEQSVIINRYGANRFLSKTYCNRIDEDETRDDYMYTVEIVRGYDQNANGFDIMKIYTKGELKEITIDRWKASPIIEMPYCWQGYDDRIDVADRYGNTYTIRLSPDSTSVFKKNGDFSKDIIAVLDAIYSLKDYFDVNHLGLNIAIPKIKQWIEEYPFEEDELDENLQKAKSWCSKLEENEDNRAQELFNQYSSILQELEKELEEKRKDD